MAVIWATPAEALALGWKNTLTTATPGRLCDSMCSMSLTVVVMARSLVVTIRFSMSSGDNPPYDQMMLTTGTSITGKMSVGVRKIVSTPRSAMNRAMTTNVRRRRSAS